MRVVHPKYSTFFGPFGRIGRPFLDCQAPESKLYRYDLVKIVPASNAGAGLSRRQLTDLA